MAIQLAALLVAVLRVPLAAQYPEPAERMAAHLLLGTQVTAAGLLFPFLFPDRRCAAQIIASAWPFQLAAGYLAGVAPRVLAWPAALTFAWLVALAAWAGVLRTPRLRAVGVALAALLTVGAGTVHYLRLEFGGGDSAPGTSLENASPLPSTFHALDGSSTRPAWILVGSLLLAAAAARFLAARHGRGRATEHPTPGRERQISTGTGG